MGMIKNGQNLGTLKSGASHTHDLMNRADWMILHADSY